jgi:hypothetical protein
MILRLNQSYLPSIRWNSVEDSLAVSIPNQRHESIHLVRRVR